MNLKGFKKTSEDDKSVTMTHDKGHTMKIALSALSEKERAEMKKLPLHKAKGGMIQKFADGGDAEPNPAPQSNPAPQGDQTPDQSQPQSPVTINIGQPNPQPNVVPQAAGQPQSQPSLSDVNSQLANMGGNQSGQNLKNINSQLAGMNQPPSNQDQDESQDESPAGGPPPPTVFYEPKISKNGKVISGGGPPPPTVFYPPRIIRSPDQSADQNEPNPQPNMGSNQSQPLPLPNAPQQKLPDLSFLSQPTNAATTESQLNQEAAKMKQDFATGQITPHSLFGDSTGKPSVWGDSTTLGKIGMIFGLALSTPSLIKHGGFIQLMRKQIDQDLDAQKVNQANKLDFLKLAEQHLVNQSNIGLQSQETKQAAANTALTQANTNLAKQNYAKTAMLLGAVQHLGNNVNTMPDGPQKQAAQGLLQGISNQSDQHIMQMNKQTAAQVEQNWQQHNAALNALAPEMAAYAAQRHVPGLGEASVPLSGEDRNELSSGVGFQQKLDRFKDWVKGHSETAALHPEDVRVGQTLAAELQGAYRQATHGGVYKEGEQNFISKLINSDPVSNFNQFTVLPQLEALSKENQERINNKAESLGLPQYNTSQAQNESKPAQQSDNIQYKGGKPYRLQGNYWVPVK